ncbi:cytochrome c [Flavobacterium sp. LS1R49]|uniref:Cytochrome c n=1 Tax=Flavobacterium shii TaxID=2987687 RepID=A0A9X2ZHV1_9FLAO|nr:cytochrome c [Flavobacterium shii]MCV9930082.1 cytochrome c [Flavobacterium shii]
MKSRILTIAALAVIVFSCATKKEAPKVVVAEPVKVVELTPALAAGQNLYDNNCAKCHKLFKATDFTKEDWKPILVRMQKKAHLDDTQMASISDYISSQL